MAAPRQATRLLVLAAAAALCGAYGGGAPPTACDQMTPGHGLPPQQSPMPYNVTLSTTVVKAGRRMTVTLSRGDQPPFKGFFVQVRYAQDPDVSPALGRFMTRQHSTVTCEPGEANGISHADNKEKEAVTLLWLSPLSLDQDVLFRVTVVQDYSTYWVGHDTAVVRVLREATAARPDAPPSTPTPTPESTPTPTPAPTTAPASAPAATTASTPAPTAAPALAETERETEPYPAEKPAPADQDAACTEDCDAAAAAEDDSPAAVYDGCLKDKGCFAITGDCMAQRNCDLLVTYAPHGDGRYRLQLYGKYQPSSYLAVGFSTDGTMGDDDVMYCTDDEDGNYRVKHAFNTAVPKSSTVVDASTEDGDLVSDEYTEYRNGFLLCEFSHAARYSVNGREVNLTSSDLHLMVARGPARGGTLNYHAARRVSGAPVELASYRETLGGSDLLYRLHGALMVAAWLGTASVGMLLARYYKQTWVGSKLAGLDLWFQGHRSLMALTVLLTIGGLVCIVLQLGGWTDTPLLSGPAASPHPLLGILCVALAVLQPLMAMCRCHPGAPRRAIFNWLHWMVGSAAHILGVATVFFAVELPAARLPAWAYWVLAAFVVFHVCTHFLLSLQQCWSDRAASRQKGRGEAYNMRDMGMNSYHVYQTDRPQEAPCSTMRRTLLGIYIVVNLLFVALVICMVVLAPADKWLDAIM